MCALCFILACNDHDKRKLTWWFTHAPWPLPAWAVHLHTLLHNNYTHLHTTQ